MHLIYKINFPSGKVYIGQTKNLNNRKSDHLKEARHNNCKVYRAMRKYNTSKEDFEILEDSIETQEEANKREIYWIAYYDSYHNGYNSTPGGGVENYEFNKGENSSKALMTNEEVLEIRKLRASKKYTRKSLYKLYEDRISESGFGKIWNYEVYTEVGQEYNTPELTEYYKHHNNNLVGENASKSKLTNELVLEIRKKYYIEAIPIKEIYKDYASIIGFSAFQRAILGNSFKNVIIPEPSFEYRKKYHKYSEEELENTVKLWIKSNLDIKSFHHKISQDSSNIFQYYSYSQFKNILLKKLKDFKMIYKTNYKGKVEFINAEKVVCGGHPLSDEQGSRATIDTQQDFKK